MTRPLLLDLFCCQGGASAGYVAAGFDVVGIDIEEQPRYPYEFLRDDALLYLHDWVHDSAGRAAFPFAAIHASPPCQAHSNAQRIQQNDHPDLIAETRKLLIATGLPYVIENVVGAPLINPVELCGSMFGLRTYRHRLFETNFSIPQRAHPPHTARQAKMGRPPRDGEFLQLVGNFSNVDMGRDVMDMPWANRDGLREAIPPAYAEFVGTHFDAAHHRRSGFCFGCCWSSRNEERMSDETNLGRGLFHLLNGETAHGLTIIQHDDEPPKATPTYMLNLNVGWADHIIAERMYLSDARGIAYLLAHSLNCPVGDVEEPSHAA